MSNKEENKSIDDDDALPEIEGMPDYADHEQIEDEKEKKSLIAKFASAKVAAKKIAITIFNKIVTKFSILKQKKYWIPLVIGHAVMFSGMGYFAYSEIKHKRSTDYVLETISTVFETNDPALLNQILNASIFIDNTYNTVHSMTKVSPDFAIYVGELSHHYRFNKNISTILLNIIKGDDATLAFDEELDLLPNNLASQLRKTPFTVNQELSDPETNTYILETNLYTIKWGNYPLKLLAQLEGDKWNITQIANLEEIIKKYDSELARKRIEQEKHVASNKIKIAKTVNQYLPNPSCIATITEIAGQQVLIVRIEAKANNMDKDMHSWTANTNINFENGNLFMQEYFTANKLFHPENIICNSWNIILSDEDIAKVSGQKLFCNAKPIEISLPDGEYYQITD